MGASETKATGQKESADSFVDGELFYGPSNHEILGDLQRQNGTAEKKICDFPRARVKKRYQFSRTVWRIDRRHFTERTMLWKELDGRLPLPAMPSPSSGLRDVYMISRPHNANLTGFNSFIHWSVYCEGLVYHLSADSASTEQFRLHSATLKSAYTKARTMLRVDKCDVASSENPPLVCYHIGQTDLDDAEITCLAQWIIRKLNRYDLFRSNCQHFTMALCVRILCRRRYFAIFTGSLAQLYAWDQLRKHGLGSGFIGSFSQGFELCSAEGPGFLRDCEIDRLFLVFQSC